MQYKHFVVTDPPHRTVEYPALLLRRFGDGWEYLSPIDWTWHPMPARRRVPLDKLVPVEPERAQRLLVERQRWVEYWMIYVFPDDVREEEMIVIRRRETPELVLDEEFTVHHRWEPTSLLGDAQALFNGYGSPAGYPRFSLTPVTRHAAEEILQRTRHVSGATEL